ncbi:uncharacterized protein LOC143242243 [Tachypleus tridentatus]|uniref:uncharacterized protein LOC143242243 n=1 Tax=Tachypleus tridentatus TaxID=6853 RepID=UPI003FCF3CDE
MENTKKNVFGKDPYFGLGFDSGLNLRSGLGRGTRTARQSEMQFGTNRRGRRLDSELRRNEIFIWMHKITLLDDNWIRILADRNDILKSYIYSNNTRRLYSASKIYS